MKVDESDGGAAAVTTALQTFPTVNFFFHPDDPLARLWTGLTGVGATLARYARVIYLLWYALYL